MNLVQGVVDGDRLALARLITQVESNHPEVQEALRLLYPCGGKARVLGITGPSGAGKSTLVNQLAREFRRRGKTVGIVAVDPSSPFTRGAILGDRVRMQDLSGDPGIFIRSMATRGATGGLAEATLDVVTVLDASGKEVVMIETVGAGQDEVEVMQAAQTVIVVSIPGSGDDIQALKAGILEIADILVVNKADRDGADSLVAYLRELISMQPTGPWTPPIIKTVAIRDDGISSLVDAVEEHGLFLQTSGKLDRDHLERIRHQVLSLARQKLYQRLLTAGQTGGFLEQLVRAVANREADPYSAAQQLLARLQENPPS